MKRGIVSVSVILFMITSLYSCFNDTGENELSSQEASALYTAVYSEVSSAAHMAYDHAANSTVKSEQTGNINYSNNDGSIVVTGNFNLDDMALTHNYSMTVNFYQYTGQKDLEIDGSTSFDLDMASQSNLKYSFTGSFSLMHYGEPHTLSWNMVMTVLNNTQSYSGYYEIDGNRYEYSYIKGGIAAR